MRNTFFDVDQDSTIVSMLATPDTRDTLRPTKNLSPLKLLLGSVAVLLLIVYWQGIAVWQ
jgi:hypothetical protein